MAVIQFTKADHLRGQLLEAGWYSWLISASSPAKPNEKKDGFNYEVTFQLIDKGPDYDGKEVKRTFSSKAIGMMDPLIAAAKGISQKDLRDMTAFDTDELIGKKIDGYCKVDTYEGNLNNKVEQYAPYKSSSNVVPFG